MRVTLEFGWIKRVTFIMLETIGNVRFERHGFLKYHQHVLCNIFDGLFHLCCNVVCLANLPVEQDGFDGARMIVHMDPRTAVETALVHRQRFVLKRVCREKRNHFFGKLVWSVIIFAMTDRHGQLECVEVGHDDMVRRGF